MEIIAQTINEALAKGTYNGSIDESIKIADQYLQFKSDNKPEWLDEFLTVNKNKLTETICRANRKNGLASLTGYSEGYFNEIIQNANDLHCGNVIDFYCSTNGDKYQVQCKYKDFGFTTSNIYGFLNREMSDKDIDKGQTGKYGIGIKSFFQFVDFFEIKSNIIIRFTIDRLDDGELDITSFISINKDWDKENTILTFNYNKNIESSFNVTKLNDLIDYLNKGSSTNVEKFLFSGKTHELVFDVRSLMFMNNFKQSISKLNFNGRYHSTNINLSFGEMEYYKLDSLKYSIRNCVVSIDKNEYEYLLCSINKMNYAFPLFDEDSFITRYYSTYFIKGADDYHFSLCINSNYSNMHRNDLGDTLESISNANKKINDSLCDIFHLFTSDEIVNSAYLNEVSIIFHDAAYHELANKTPFFNSIFRNSSTNINLPLTQEDNHYLYVVNRNIKEKYESCSFNEGNITNELIECFNTVFLNSEVLFLNELEDKNLCEVINIAYNELMEMNNTYNKDIDFYNVLLNFFPTVQSFVSYRISGKRDNLKVSDSDIDAFLLSNSDNSNDEYILKIFGRYELNEAIEYDGSINTNKVSFLEFLFNPHKGKITGLLEAKQAEIYQTKFMSLKQSLLKNRYYDVSNRKNKYMIPFIEPDWTSLNRWDGTFDYDYDSLHTDVYPIEDTDKYLFLKQLIKDSQLGDNILYFYKDIMLFEKVKRKFRPRSEYFAHFHYCKQQLINITDCFKIQFKRFEPFLDIITNLEQITQHVPIAIIYFKCILNSISSEELINDILPLVFENKNYFIDYTKDYQIYIEDLLIDSRSELEESEKFKFIQRMTNLKIKLFKYNSSSRTDSVIYMHDGQVKANFKSKDSFMALAECNINDDSLIIFYDNFKGNLDNVLQLVLANIGIGSTTLEFVKAFVGTVESVIALDYKSYESINSLVPGKTDYDWQPNNDLTFSITYDYDLIKTVLSSRGNYGDTCPICGNQTHYQKIIVLSNQANKKDTYIVTICCNDCFEHLKDTLSNAKLSNDIMTIEKKSYHGQSELLVQRSEIQLSPMNMEIIKLFNKKVK